VEVVVVPTISQNRQAVCTCISSIFHFHAHHGPHRAN
jgi:hypothetical protein